MPSNLIAQPPIRVLFDARMVHYRRAGIGQYAINLLRAFATLPEVNAGGSVSVLQMRGDKRPIVNSKGFRRVSALTPPHNRIEQLGLGVELLRLSLLRRPQLIHCPDFVPPRFRAMPAVVNVQDLAFLKFPETTLLTDESKRYYGQVPWAVQSAQALITLSESARDDMVALLNVPPERIEVIPAGVSRKFRPPVDLAAAQSQAAKSHGLPLPEAGGYILFVSTIEPRKNLPLLLEAYSIARDAGRINPMPALAVVGRAGWLYERVYARIEELGLKGHVRLLGGVPDDELLGLYQGARAFAMPSLYEGFGLPALEAMACGVPVLASSSGSLPEVVGDAGLLLNPADVDDWSGALERVLLDSDLTRELREAGPLRAELFSWEAAARQTWQLYRKVIGA